MSAGHCSSGGLFSFPGLLILLLASLRPCDGVSKHQPPPSEQQQGIRGYFFYEEQRLLAEAAAQGDDPAAAGIERATTEEDIALNVGIGMCENFLNVRAICSVYIR